MKTLFRALCYSLGVFVIFCAMLVLFAVGNTPETELGWTLTHDDVVRAKQILHEGSKTRPDEIHTIMLTEADLNLAGNYLLNRYSKSAVKIELKNERVRFNVTMTLPRNSLGKYLNISFRLGHEDNAGPDALPGITKFKAGKLLLPARLAAFAIDTFIRHTSLNDYFILATRPIKAVQIDGKQLTITYNSDAETLRQAKNFLTQGHGGDAQAQNIYQQKLAEIVAHHDPAWRLSLAELLKPLFELAYQRSTLENAVEESRLVIFTVNDYVNRRETEKLLPAVEAEPTTEQRYSAFMYKRIDLAKHFIGSAALTAAASGQVAKVMGEEKELSDAQSGSGFSFIDLAADKAGTRFGEIAISSPENARKIQRAMSQIKDYRDFMPDPRDLPENMNEAEFKQRFGSIDSEAYREVLRQIDFRISAAPIYKGID